MTRRTSPTWWPPRFGRQAPLRRPGDGRGHPRGVAGRATDRTHGDRVQPSPIPPLEPSPGRVEEPDPRPRMELRLRRGLIDRGDLRELPAEEGRRHGAPA